MSRAVPFTATAPVRVNAQTLRQFAPSDAVSLARVPNIEAKYRLIRNEWLTCASRLKQAQEYREQVERAKAHVSVIEEARAAEYALATELGTWRRLALLAQQRAEAEVYREIARSMLPLETRKAIDAAVEDVLQRGLGDMARQRGASKPGPEDYKLFDAILSRLCQSNPGLHDAGAWVTVPAEPTDDMIDASVNTLAKWRMGLTADERILHSRIVDGRTRTYMDPREKHRARYRAMLAAAPRKSRE